MSVSLEDQGMHEANIDSIRNSINCINVAVLGGANDKQFLKSTERPLDVRRGPSCLLFFGCFVGSVAETNFHLD